MQTRNRSNSTDSILDWIPADSEALPCISPQDLKAMDALFKNIDPESVERDLLPAKPPVIDWLDWSLVD